MGLESEDFVVEEVDVKCQGLLERERKLVVAVDVYIGSLQ